jgi:cytochrome c-type biogenesis protein CcmF
MLALLGALGLLAALFACALLVWRGISAARGVEGLDLRGPVRLLVSGGAIAMGAMQIALLGDDFSLEYVANHHSTSTPFPFDVATAWAALEGSILLWGLVLCVYTWLTFRHYQKAPDPLGAGALAVLGGVGIFFFGLMLTVANPFEVCTSALEVGCAASSPWPFASVSLPADGPGPNPLLQNHILMAFHPPMLYMGYVGLTVPFAYAISALALGRPGPDWLRRSHRSTLLAWSFLSLGIVLGGWWAYEVLSWGGYWAWDPVENASFMPWLVATAFIHSALVQQRRGMLQAWNFILVISAFSLTILGTFLTRSGTINSVHSFTQSAIGPALLGFLVLVLVGSFILFSMRSDVVATAPRIDRLVSREGSFLANNLILSLYAFVVLVGTIYPMIVEAVTGDPIGVGGPFYNRLAVPLSMALLLVMGLGPVTPWQSAEKGQVWRRVRLPALLSLVVGLLTAVFVSRLGWVVLVTVLGSFVILTIAGLLLHQAARRSAKSGAGMLTSIRAVATGDAVFWAGQVSHVGVVLVAIGIAFAANLGSHARVDLTPGEAVSFSGFEIVYQSPFQRESPGKTTLGARLEVSRDGRFLGFLEPGANYFGNDQAGVSTPDVMTRPGGDLYATLLDLDPDTARLAFDTSPLIWLLWFGGLTVASGGALSILARRAERKPAVERQTADV